MACYLIFDGRNVIFDKVLIEFKLNNPNANLTTTLEIKVTFKFLSFCFLYIFGTDNTDTPALFNIPALIEYNKPIISSKPTLSSPNIKDKNVLSNVSDASDKFDNNILIAKTLLIINTMAILV